MARAGQWVDRERRSSAWVKVHLGTESGTADGVITNISTRGCRIRSHKSLKLGENIRLRVPGLGSVMALIRWSDTPYAGAEFLPDTDNWDHDDQEGRRDRITSNVVTQASAFATPEGLDQFQ